MKSESKKRASASMASTRKFKYHFRYNMVFISRKPTRARAAPKNVFNWAMSKPPVIGTTTIFDNPEAFELAIESRLQLSDDVNALVVLHDNVYYERKHWKLLTRSFIGHIIGEYGYAIQD